VRSLRNLLHGLLVSFVAAACIANCSGAPGESASLGAQLEVSSAPIVAPRRPRLRGGPPRASGQPCRVPEDCASLICQPPVRGETVTRCADPSANDGVKNDAETDVDCGGGVQLGTGGAPACPDRESCQVDGDCLSGYCSPTTARCVAGRSCKGLVPAAMIDDEQAGIDTCGVGESTDPPYERAHESCCRSLLLPTATDPAGAPLARVRMDKYEVTSGRMRQFVEGVKASTGSYDLRAWATGEVLAGTKAGRLLAEQMPTTTTATQSSFLTFLPTSNDPRDPLNLPAQLGATSMDANVPSEYQGCYSAPGAFGATDYWQGPEIQKAFWSPPREFPQADYDIKPINCAPYWMYAAFCAWDGGRLPTLAEVVSAWGPDQYPWGSSFIPSPYPYDIVGEGESSHRHARIPAPSVEYTVNWNNDSYEDNRGDFYFFPNDGLLTDAPASIASGADLTPYIAAPGRFFLDVTRVKSPSFGGNEGWQDLGANMIEATEISTFSGWSTFCDCATFSAREKSSLPACECPAPGSTPPVKPGVVRATNLPNMTLIGGSWEGHETADPASSPYLWVESFSKPVQSQYGKTGFRCVRPVSD